MSPQLEISNFSKLKDSPLELFQALHQVWSKEIRSVEKKTTNIIIELSKEQRLDLCGIALCAIDEGFLAFDAHHILEDAIPFLTHNLESLVNYLQRLHSSMKNDILSSRQYVPVANLAKKQPKFARKLLYELINSGEPFIVGYISEIFKNLPNATIESLHGEILTLLSHPKSPVVQGAIISLGNLKYHTTNDKKLIEATFTVFDKFVEKKSESISEAIIISITQLYYLGIDETKSRILSLAKLNNPQLCYQVSRFLFLNHENLINDEWFRELLMTLSSTSCRYTAIIRNLNSILCVLLDTHKKKKLLEEFFTTWLSNSDCHTSESKLSVLFGLTLSKLLEDTKFVYTLITKYFNHDNHKLNHAASDLVEYCNIHKKYDIILDQSILQSLKIEDVLYICRKVMGYVLDVKSLCNIFYSILTAKPNDANVQSLITEVFIKYIGADYLKTTLDFLKEKLSTSEIPSDLKATVTAIIAALESRQNTLRSLPRLNELAVSEVYEYQLFLEDNKTMEKACVLQV